MYYWFSRFFYSLFFFFFPCFFFQLPFSRTCPGPATSFNDIRGPSINFVALWLLSCFPCLYIKYSSIFYDDFIYKGYVMVHLKCLHLYLHLFIFIFVLLYLIWFDLLKYTEVFMSYVDLFVHSSLHEVSVLNFIVLWFSFVWVKVTFILRMNNGTFENY